MFSSNGPWYVAVNATGDVYGCIWGQNVIYKFDSKGNAAVFGTAGCNLTGLAFDKRGNLYAADEYQCSGSVVKFDTNGNASTYISGVPTPLNVAFDSSDNLYVATMGFGVQRFDNNGNYLSTWGNGLWVYGLAFDKGGNLFVTCGDGQIRMFDSSGKGTVIAPLYSPVGIAFDSEGNFYVAGWNFGDSGTIQKFDPEDTDATFASGLSPRGDWRFFRSTPRQRS